MKRETVNQRIIWKREHFTVISFTMFKHSNVQNQQFENKISIIEDGKKSRDTNSFIT